MKNTRTRSAAMIIAALVGLALPALAEISAISDTFVDSMVNTNLTGRDYQIDSILVDPDDSTAQVLTLSAIIDSVTYTLDTISVAGDAAWTADKIIQIPADAVLSIASDASVTNRIYITRSEIGAGSRVIVSGSLSAGAVGTAEIAADAITGAKIDDDAVDSEHIAAGAVDNEHLAVDIVTADEMADADHGDVSWASGVATVEGASGASFTIGSSSADAGYFAFVDNTQLVFVATYTNGTAISAVTNVIDADITTP
jgi:hypothetical protein